MDMNKFLDKAAQRDEGLHVIIREWLSKSSKSVTLRAVAWAVENDHHISDVFHDFDEEDPHLTHLALFLNRAYGDEQAGNLSFARYRRGGAPVLVLMSCTARQDPRWGILVMAQDITTFEEFTAAYEAHNETLRAAGLPVHQAL